MRVTISALTLSELRLPEEPAPTLLELLLGATEGEPLATTTLTVQGKKAVVNSATVTVPSLDAGLLMQVRMTLPAAAAEGEGEGEGPTTSILCTADLTALGVGKSATGATEGRLHGAALAAGEGGGGGAPPPEPAKGGKGAPPPQAAAEPSGESTLSCFWRTEVDFLDVSLERVAPLAVRYFMDSNRDESRGRQSMWREEMANERSELTGGEANLGLGATRRYDVSAPLKPSYLMGDPTSRAARYGYARDKTALSITLTAQHVQVQLARLVEQLLACVSAEQATDVLFAIRKFLMQGANLMQIDAQELLTLLQKLFLPFERLVRSVWEEGPEVAYDRTKATLIRMMEAELQNREKEAAYASSKGTYGPKPLVSQMVHDMRVAAPPPRPPPAKVRYLATSTAGQRIGLVSYKGTPAAATKVLGGPPGLAASVGAPTLESKRQSLAGSVAGSIAPSKAASVSGRQS